MNERYLQPLRARKRYCNDVLVQMVFAKMFFRLLILIKPLHGRGTAVQWLDQNVRSKNRVMAAKQC